MFDKKSLEKLTEETYRSFGLFLKEYPRTYVSVDDCNNYFYVGFNTNGAFHIQSLFYFSQGLIVIKNISTYPRKGEGFGRKMVEATEEIAKKTQLYNSFILHNGNPSFWTYIGYKLFKNSVLKQTINKLNVQTPNALMYKNLI